MKKFLRGTTGMGRTVGWWLLLFAMLLTSHVAQSQPTDQYKRRSQDAFTQLVSGDIGEAERLLDLYEADYPGDIEARFVRTLLYAATGRLDEALATAREAVHAGLPPGRFVAGPRSRLEPLLALPEWQTWIDSLDVSLVHGPMLGRLGPSEVHLWVRTARPAEVVAEVRSMDGSGTTIRTRPITTRPSDDYTGELAVEGLTPQTRYTYTLEIDGERYPESWVFETPQASGSPDIFRIAFGGGAGFTPWHEPIWDVIASRDPLAFLFLGDNVYIDNPEMPEVQQYTYYRRQSVPRYRQFVGSTGIYAIWDDHDFTINDGWGGPDIESPAWKREVWNLYRQNWINPAYGGGQAQPGVWYRFSIADVEFFMLDGRYYREDPGNAAPRSMLGQAQKRWLLDALDSSEATFKVLVSPVPWAEGTKPGSLDTWDGYAEEREDIFGFIEANGIEGVVLLSADRHRSDLWRIPRPGAYDLFEFESSRLTNVHFHEIMPGAEFGYNEKCSFGLLTFDTAREEPQVTYEIVNIENETIFSFMLPLRRLTLPTDR